MGPHEGAPPIKDRHPEVSIVLQWKPVCHVDGCPWQGTAFRTYTDADAERNTHAAWHRDNSGL